MEPAADVITDRAELAAAIKRTAGHVKMAAAGE